MSYVDMTNQTGKKKRMNNFTGRLSTTLEAQEAANPCDVEVDPINVNFKHVRPPRRGGIHGSANSAIDGNVGNNEGKFIDLLVTYRVLLLLTIVMKLRHICLVQQQVRSRRRERGESTRAT